MNWLARFAAWLGRLAGNGQAEPRRPGHGGDATANTPRDNSGNGSSRQHDSWQELDEREIELKLPGRFSLDVSVRGALKTAPGVVFVEDI